MDAPRFRFRKPGRLIDGDLELELVKTSPGDPSRKRVPSYEFAMKRSDTGVVVGHLYLRIGPARTLRCRI
jgi:hypothetical protein